MKTEIEVTLRDFTGLEVPRTPADREIIAAQGSFRASIVECPELAKLVVAVGDDTEDPKWFNVLSEEWTIQELDAFVGLLTALRDRARKLGMPRSAATAIRDRIARKRHRPIPFALADGVCPLCFTAGQQHVVGCPRGTSPERISAIIETLPDLPHHTEP